MIANYLTVKDIIDFENFKKTESSEYMLGAFLVSRFFKVSFETIQNLDIKIYNSLNLKVMGYLNQEDGILFQEALMSIKDDITDKDVLNRFELLDL